MKIKVDRIIYSNYYRAFFACFFAVTFVTIIFSANFFDRIRSFTSKYSSMSPVIDSGSVVVDKKYDQYRVGDIITYYALNNGNQEIVTHRVLSIGGNVYVTKGDANQAIDREIVVPRLIIGKVVLIVPYVGYLVSFAKGPIGVWLVVILPGALIISAELYKIYLEVKKN